MAEYNGWDDPKMTHVKVKTVITAGALVRGQVRREMNSYCFMHGLELDTQEDKGWFESDFQITITGEKSKVKLFVDALDSWVKLLQEA